MISGQESASEYAVQTVEVWKTYSTGSIEYQALKGVSVGVKRGEFVSVVGPSGSGKSTFLNLLGTLDVPTKGEVLIDGTPTSRIRGNDLARLRNTKLGFVFQSYNLISYLSATDNVELPLVARGVGTAERRARAQEVLTELGIGEKGGKKPNQLSGGEQQRVAIARALANSPAVILADEPTGNLDTKSSEVVVSILRRVSEEDRVTVVMVTHNLELTPFTHRVIHLRDGVIEKVVEN